MHSADGLQLVGGVEDGLHQQDVGGLDDVQPVGARVEGEEEDVDLVLVLEGAEVLLGQNRQTVNGQETHRRCSRQDGLTWNLWIPLIWENSMLLSNKALAMMSRTFCHCSEPEQPGQTQTHRPERSRREGAVTVEKTRHLAPGSRIWILFSVLTTASTLVEWLP